MLELTGLSLWAVLLAWIVNMAVGAIWYSPIGFAKQWKAHTKIDILKIPQNQATKILSFVALSGLIQAITLGVIINSLEVTSVMNGLVVGLVLWFGLTAATTVGVTLYSLRSWGFLWLNSSYFLLVMAVNSMIFALWN